MIAKHCCMGIDAPVLALGAEASDKAVELLLSSHHSAHRLLSKLALAMLSINFDFPNESPLAILVPLVPLVPLGVLVALVSLVIL